MAGDASPSGPKKSSNSGLLTSFGETTKKLALPLQKSVLFGVVLSLKQLLNKVAFTCPETYYTSYSMLFICVPALGFPCIALMTSKTLWKTVMGTFSRHKGRRKIRWNRSRRLVYLSCVPPIAWLFLVFFDKQYYVCAKLGPVNVRNRKETSLTLAELHAAETESQIIAFLLLAAVIVIAVIIISIDRCYTKADSSIGDDDDYIHDLTEKQTNLFNSKIKELAQKEAHAQVESWFDEYKHVSDPAEKIRHISNAMEGDYQWH